MDAAAGRGLLEETKIGQSLTDKILADFQRNLGFLQRGLTDTGWWGRGAGGEKSGAYIHKLLFWKALW